MHHCIGLFVFLPPVFDHSGGGDFKVTPGMKTAFEQQGYVLVRSLLDSEETGRVREALESQDSVWKHSFGIKGKDGRLSRLCVWSNPGNDVTGVLARCEKMAGTCETLLGGEVYHYHSKLMMKEADIGGKFLWHQDYGYWYQNGNLFPDMMTAFVAVDGCTKENGCLKILPGSHLCGRLDHTLTEGQQGAELERVEHIKSRLPVMDVVMEPGDCLFFHCNLLHSSGPNLSPSRRWALLVAYNRRSNNPVREHQHPRYRPLTKAQNSLLKTCPLTEPNPEVKEFMDPSKSRTLANVERPSETQRQ
ncbi:L-proline trans-4-hydroxylase [Aplysia californica]|uniref:L-proline trans-4-hydroxylase n=1 Tax=Aplysia californica TaxID=6500 RepID=A0ABM0ZWY5_APLCA|nr:L-proline trans-4-hydroxylase [Aplysia californica]